MHWYHVALIAGALATVAVSWRVPRSTFWVAIGAVSFTVSSMWHNAGLPYGAAFGATTNALVCMMIYSFARREWELRVWNCFHLMIVLEIMMLAGVIQSHYAFAVALELANWLALAIIATTGIVERIGAHGPFSRNSFRGVFSVLNHTLRAKRRRDQFWRE